MKNRKLELPRIVSPDNANWTFDRNNFLNGDIAAYWGPKQSPQIDKDEYTPPTKWPKAGTLLSIPKVARLLWQHADLDAEAFVVGGFTGTYSYGFHTTTFDLDIDASDPGVFDSHIHQSYIMPGFGSQVEFYGVQQTTALDGFLALGDGNTLTATGSSSTWFLWSYMSAPFSLKDYYALNSLTAGAIQFAWLLLLNGFTPSESFEGTDGAPPINSTPDGFFSVGSTDPILTGRYSIDMQIYDDGTGPHVPADPITVPEGYNEPEVETFPDHMIQWQLISEKLESFYEDSTAPYVNAYQLPQYHPDFPISVVTPWKDTYLGCNSIHIMVFCRPMIMTDTGSAIERITKAYPYMKGYSVICYTEEPYMTDSHLPSAPIQELVDQITQICNTKGWSYGGSLDYKNVDACFNTIKQNIEDFFEEPEE